MIVTTHPEAEAELIDSATYYAREAGRSLGEAFIAEFSRTVALLREHPKLGVEWRGQLRRFPLRRFPYSIVYQETKDGLRIVALAHQSRRPGYWRTRT